MSTATLEVYLADVGRMAMLAYRPELQAVTVETVHSRAVVAEHLDPLPLCWVADGQRRTVPATVEDWEVSFDHETLPSYAVVDDAAHVTCADCKEWMHA